MVSLTTYLNLIDLFINKGWKIEKDNDIGYFKRYYNTITQFSSDEQEFIIELSKRFLHVPQKDYVDYLTAPIKKLLSSFPNDQIFITPCVSKEDKGKIKSSSNVVYLFRGSTLKTYCDISRISVVNADYLIDVNDNFDDKIIVLVDDFIGTGDTAHSAIEFIKETSPLLNNEHIVVLSLVAMKSGIERLKKEGIIVFCSEVESKGITGYYKEDQLAHSIEMMRRIESDMISQRKKIKEDFHFGYKGSEALVCMERCPNDTFPIYWLGKGSPYER